MKTNTHCIILSIILLFSLITFVSDAQTAFDYEGIYTRFDCNGEVEQLLPLCELVAVGPNNLIIRNFMGIPNDFLLSSQEDTVIIQMDFNNLLLIPQEITDAVDYYIGTTDPVSFYVTSGEIFTDSIKVEYFFGTPEGAVSRCAVYKKGGYLNISEEKVNDEFQVYPNPAKDQITFKIPASVNSQEFRFVVHSIDGRSVQSIEFENDHELTIDTSSYPSGTYMVSFISANSVIRKQVVIE